MQLPLFKKTSFSVFFDFENEPLYWRTGLQLFHGISLFYLIAFSGLLAYGFVWDVVLQQPYESYRVRLLFIGFLAFCAYCRYASGIPRVLKGIAYYSQILSIPVFFFSMYALNGADNFAWAGSCLCGTYILYGACKWQTASLFLFLGILIAAGITYFGFDANLLSLEKGHLVFFSVFCFAVVTGIDMAQNRDYHMYAQTKGATRALSVLAHEVRSPLLALSNGLDSVQDVLCDTSPNCPEIEIVNRLQRRIRDVQNGLNFYLHNMQASTKEKLLIETFPAESVINDVTETLASTTTMPFKVEVEPCLVAGNKVGTRQVLMNLVRNAINACSAVQHDTCITIRGSIENNTYIFSVIDTAASLSHKNAENIFEPFITYSRNGMGIGLYVSRLICEKMGCDLRFKIESGSSTTFFFPLKTSEHTSHS